MVDGVKTLPDCKRRKRPERAHTTFLLEVGVRWHPWGAAQRLLARCSGARHLPFAAGGPGGHALHHPNLWFLLPGGEHVSTGRFALLRNLLLPVGPTPGPRSCYPSVTAFCHRGERGARRCAILMLAPPTPCPGPRAPRTQPPCLASHPGHGPHLK